MIIILSIHTLFIVRGTQEATFLLLQWRDEEQTGSADMGKLVNVSVPPRSNMRQSEHLSARGVSRGWSEPV